MDFITPALLGGAALAAVPIVLHLVMRQQPRHLEFPALRFLRQRKEANQRRLKLRHLILLALRVGAIVLLALALARPVIKSTGGIGDQEAPAAVAMVFDTAPRMAYRHENKTRLQAAQDIGDWLLPQLPAESQVAVVDSRPGKPVFQIDAAAAKQRIERLEPVGGSRPLVEVLYGAVELLKESELARKEIYLFTDLSRAAWNAESAARLHAKIAELESLGFYVIDVGVEQPQNFSLGELQLSGQLLAKNSPLRVSTELADTGVGGQRVVEVYLLDGRGTPQKRSEQALDVPAGGMHPVDFPLGGLDQGVHQGYVRVVGQDGLAIDDLRYFTVEVKPPWKVLIVAASPEAYRAAIFTEAIAPADFRKTGQARFDCDVIPFDRLATQPLDSYAAICLLDPPPLSDDTWKHLGSYASSGGGVAMFLGPNTKLSAFNGAAAQELLPGPLAAQARYPDGTMFLATAGLQHPMLGAFRALGDSVHWEEFPVYRFWQFKELQDGVGTIVSFVNRKPALLEKPLGKGRVLTFVTPISELAEVPDDERWNQLWGVDSWPFFTLTNELMLYLVGSVDAQLNYLAGQTVVVALDPERQFDTYLLSTPQGDPVRLAADAERNAIVVASTDAPGNYRLRAGGAEQGVDRGFSVNYAPEASDLARIAPEQIKELLGSDSYRLARSREQIDREISLDRVGREVFPILIALMAMALGIEHVLANRFYRTSKE